MSETPTYEVLADQLNTKFSLSDFAGSHELELIEITERTVTSSQTYFSLYFRGGKDFVLPQATYRTRQARLGETFFFLVPTASDASGYIYGSVFNLLNEPPNN